MKYGAHTEVSDDDGKSKKATAPKKVSDLSDTEILEKMKKYAVSWYDYWYEFIECAREHMKFLYIDQWDIEVRDEREANKIPTMEFNHIRTMIDGIAGLQKKNSPQITVSTISGEPNKNQEVDFRTDILRQIAYASKSDDAYQTCYMNQLICGWGFIRASIHYESPDSFDQTIKITSNPDCQVAFFDPNATDVNRADGDFCGVYQRIAKDDFRRDYPEIESPVSTGQETCFTWETRDTITICDIYYKDYFKKVIVRLSDGRTLSLKEAKEIIEEEKELVDEYIDAITGDEADEIKELALEQMTQIIERREVMDYDIRHVRFVENAIIDKSEWPGKLLPIVYVPGNSATIDGRENPISFVNDLQDVQKLHNYTMSEMARGLANVSKSKVIGTEKMISGHEQAWRQPEKVQGMLLFNPDHTIEGRAPIFIDPPPFNQALISLHQLTDKEIGSISGRYEESRGQESNAMSGIAIQSRITAANNAVNMYLDNNLKGIEQVGRVCLDLLPYVYGDERDVIVRSEDGSPKKITVNKRKEGVFNMPNDSSMDSMDEMEEQIENAIDSDEDFDITVKASGSFDSQKQASLDFWIKMMGAFPPSAPLLADLVAGESEAEGAAIASQRLKTLLPPDIRAQEEGKPMPPPQPNPMIEIEKKRTAIYGQEVKMKQQKLDDERKKDQIDAAIDMQELKLKQRDQAYKEEKAERDAKIAQLRAALEVKKVQIQQQRSRGIFNE
jgi:hypothetical protein